MTTALLTGFEPFAGADRNASWDAVELVASGWSGPVELVTARLPVEFGRAGDELLALVDSREPAVVVATGVAVGRRAVTPERVALNLDDARIPDNAGRRPLERRIVDDGPDARFTRLPIRAMVERMTAAGLSAEESLSAGSYVCNHVFYRLLHHLEARGTAAGFIHVPDAAQLPVEHSAAALRLALDTALESIPAAGLR